MPTSELKPITLQSAALAMLCAVLWGGLSTAVRYSQEEDLPPLGTAAMRFAIASVLLAIWARLQAIPLAISMTQSRMVAPVGVLLFMQIGSYHLGMSHTNAAHGSVLIGSYPVFVAVVAHFALPGDRLSVMRLVGQCVAFGGVMAVVAGGATGTAATDSGADRVTLFGDATILASSFLIGVNTVFTKRALAGTNVTALLFWSNLLAVGLFFAGSLCFEGLSSYRFSAASAWGLAYQGVVVAWFCFLVWTALLRRHRASQLSVYGFAQPLCGMLFGAWLRGDPMTGWLLVGGLAVAVGIVLVTKFDGA
ncbi:MAG TPA: DMT family transporter [Pirellulales bacterium]|nr:DMT family transporter [Pirellulales bacterium]